MSRLCLDTSAYTHLKAGNPQVIKLVVTAKSVVVPTIVLGELRAGFAAGQRQEKNESELQSFLDSPVVQISSVDDDVSTHYAEIFLELRTRGTPIPTNDMWIAATAIKEGATIVTFDKHFDAIRRVGTVLLTKS